MSAPIQFLNALAHAYSSMALYESGHPARESAVDDVAEELKTLLKETASPVFCFIDDEVIFRDRPIRELRTWPLGQRLSDRKIQRLEFRSGVTREEVDRFLDQVHSRLKSETVQTRQETRLPHITFGPIRLPDELPFDFIATIETVEGLQGDALSKGRVSESLARGVVQTLSQAMQYSRKLLVPLIPLKRTDQYTTIHSINVSVLSMGLAEFLHFGGGDVRRIGEAALLHDTGKVLIPPEILAKPGKLTPDEWEIVRRHPVDGARILMGSGPRLELSATAAYEHHVTWQGRGGYPTLRYHRRPHPVSRLIQVCDVYDACRTRRPFREPLTPEAAVEILTSGAGEQFDPQMVRAFEKMMSSWDSRIVTVGERGGAGVAGTRTESISSSPTS